MSSADVTIEGCDTLPKLFLKKSTERGDRIAMREKDFGIWQSYSWNDYRAYALDIANGLLSLGLQRGDVVSIQSEDCREWLWADVGAMLAGGVVNGIYPTYQSRQVEHALHDSKCRFLFVEDEEQLDKFLEIEDALPHIEKVTVFDWRGLRGFEHAKVGPIDDLYEIGRAFGAQNEGSIERIVEQGSGDELAALVYTSGTTGLPKGAMLSQRYIIFQMKSSPDYLRLTADDSRNAYSRDGCRSHAVRRSILRKAPRRSHKICRNCLRPMSLQCRASGKSFIRELRRRYPRRPGLGKKPTK